MRATERGPRVGEAVQVEPMKPVLKAPGSKHLKLNHNNLLTRFAFNFNLRRYTSAAASSPLASYTASPDRDRFAASPSTRRPPASPRAAEMTCMVGRCRLTQ